MEWRTPTLQEVSLSGEVTGYVNADAMPEADARPADDERVLALPCAE